MDGFIFIIFLLFFVFPFLKRLNKNAKKSNIRTRNRPKQANPWGGSKSNAWGADHGQVRQQRHQDLHRNDSSNVFPEDHDDRVRARDIRDRKEYRRMETNIHSRHNNAMKRVSNKSRLDWGARGESGMTSSKGVAIFFLLLLLAYFITAAFAPELLSGK